MLILNRDHVCQTQNKKNKTWHIDLENYNQFNIKLRYNLQIDSIQSIDSIESSSFLRIFCSRSSIRSKHQFIIFFTSFIVGERSIWFVGRAHRATLANGDLGCFTVPQLFTHQFLTHHNPRVAHADSTWLWVPYLIVGVSCAIFCAGLFTRQNQPDEYCR